MGSPPASLLLHGICQARTRLPSTACTLALLVSALQAAAHRRRPRTFVDVHSGQRRQEVVADQHAEEHKVVHHTLQVVVEAGRKLLLLLLLPRPGRALLPPTVLVARRHGHAALQGGAELGVKVIAQEAVKRAG